LGYRKYIIFFSICPGKEVAPRGIPLLDKRRNCWFFMDVFDENPHRETGGGG
jgi:hypothetical protein